MIKHLATVITNLLSAIPWIGQDFVEFVKYNPTFIITLSIICYYVAVYCCYKNLPLFTTVLYRLYSRLSTVGKVSESALRGRRTDEDKQSYLSIPYNFLSMLIGFIDGDGYIAITKAGLDNIRIELVLSVHINDLPLLEHIKKILNIGRINVYPNISTAKLIIGKVAPEVFFPLIIHHKLFFLTDTRRKQFNLCMYLLENNITKFSLIPEATFIKDLFTLPF